ncbi:hypothetical protein FD05_GL000283 [Lentilactobacillus otakiensis DSM 19908 = JCM 15040]|uniref:Uncharacterized protein n=1 Tax=Lentilactobacillus otakiensis DSM 19908 = JCM 15040 TaxID=1423780 RepID=S4PPE9_9LACO|nr:hypothetical protein FD05_GL000283 [Lentilactobacillus otakiensis DSM 19908 = JCM 15040]MBZ3776519.1 hypothetical protein [Lentilactobacillus otakiensis]MDV3518526.1 hypothetical protein [Lentilactobacillus otakiensis]GAD16420.1 hypothetical protein LOT_0958 [Lentilactobacillus otakiensis DSM 19908 = JCM 15040]
MQNKNQRPEINRIAGLFLYLPGRNMLEVSLPFQQIIRYLCATTNHIDGTVIP